MYSLPYCILYLILKKILESKILKSMTRRSISLKCFSPKSQANVYNETCISGTETPAPKKPVHSPFHTCSRNILWAKQTSTQHQADAQ